MKRQSALAGPSTCPYHGGERGPTVQETTKTTVSYVGLLAVFVTATGYMTFTLSGRMVSLESRMSSLERRMDRIDTKMDHIDARMDRIEAKIDTLDEKFDKLLIALAGRGVVLPAKPARIDSAEGK